MFPKTLQCAVGPPRTLPRECAHAFWRFRPGDGTGHVNDSLSMSMQRQSEIGVFGKRLQTQAARLVNRILADGADRARHHRDAVQAVVSASVEIETARIFQRLTTRDERT